MKEHYEELKMDVVVFEADIRTAEAVAASGTGRENPPAVSPDPTTGTTVVN